MHVNRFCKVSDIFTYLLFTVLCFLSLRRCLRLLLRTACQGILFCFWFDFWRLPCQLTLWLWLKLISTMFRLFVGICWHVVWRKMMWESHSLFNQQLSNMLPYVNLKKKAMEGWILPSRDFQTPVRGCNAGNQNF